MTTVVAVDPAERERQSDPGSGVALRDVVESRPVGERAVPSLHDDARSTDAEPTVVAVAMLSEESKEQIFGVVSAALGETLLPLLEKQKDLEARLVGLQQAAARAPAPVAAQPARASLVQGTYGFVTAPETLAPRPEMEIALERVGPVEMPDFGRGRRTTGIILVGLLLAGVVAAIAATILSHA